MLKREKYIFVRINFLANLKCAYDEFFKHLIYRLSCRKIICAMRIFLPLFDDKMINDNCFEILKY